MTQADRTGLEQAGREQALTDRVVASFSGAQSPRLAEVLGALVRHVHDFAREVRLTEDEWQRGIEFLTATGHRTDERRQEFILLSDVVGLSMQVITINNPAHASATESTVFGPFFLADSPEIGIGGDAAQGAHGTPCWVQGTVRDHDGAPVAGARIEVWECDETGRYDVQHGDGRVSGRAHLFTDENGFYSFWAVKPVPYPIPTDGPVGMLLSCSGRSPMRAAHLHFMVSAAGLRTLVTHVFVAGDVHLADDSVFGVRDSLIRDFVDQPAGRPTPDGRDLDEAWTRTEFDVVLAPES